MALREERTDEGFDEEARRKLQRFLQGRRTENTREYVEKIISYLGEARVSDNKEKKSRSEIGWVRVKTLLYEFVGQDNIIKNQTTFYRLMDDLFLDRIIDKRTKKIANERGRQATFYRTPLEYRREWVLDRKGIEELCADRMRSINDLSEQLSIAQQLLVEKGCQNPYSAIKEIYVQRHQIEPSCRVSIDQDLIQKCTDKNGHVDPAKIIESIRKERSGFKNST